MTTEKNDYDKLIDYQKRMNQLLLDMCNDGFLLDHQDCYYFLRTHDEAQIEMKAEVGI